MLSHAEAIDYCLKQHSTGLAIWDSQEKYLDVKYIVGRNGKDLPAHTALHNPDREECMPSAPCGANGKLVRSLDFYQLLTLFIVTASVILFWTYYRDGIPTTLSLTSSQVRSSTRK